MVAREEVKFACLFWDTNLTNWSLRRKLRVKHQLVKKKGIATGLKRRWPRPYKVVCREKTCRLVYREEACSKHGA